MRIESIEEKKTISVREMTQCSKEWNNFGYHQLNPKWVEEIEKHVEIGIPLSKREQSCWDTPRLNPRVGASLPSVISS